MILIILLIIAVAAIFIYLLVNRNKAATLRQTGTEADAIILSMQLTGLCIKNDIQAIIQLQVKPERGKSFVSDVKEMISATDYTQIQPGTKIRVRFNPRNQKEILILKETFSKKFI